MRPSRRSAAWVARRLSLVSLYNTSCRSPLGGKMQFALVLKPSSAEQSWIFRSSLNGLHTALIGPGHHYPLLIHSGILVWRRYRIGKSIAEGVPMTTPPYRT